MKDQHRKCAYCEKFIETSYNDVDHYRPKTKYYWLGHSWDNLLYSCPICNRSNKNDKFPLEDENTRCNTTHDNIEQEKTLLINPYIDDPLNHIKFNEHIIVGIDNKGKTTEKELKLNRPELRFARKQQYERYEIMIKTKKIAETIYNQELMDLCNQSIAEMKSMDSPFSGMLIGILE
jgi:uncharacterized protein (TIGR02646 family)